MSKQQLHDFASTSRKGLPKKTGNLKTLAGQEGNNADTAY